MGQVGKKRHRSPARAFVRPLVMLTVGAVAGVAIWRVLMADPGGLPDEQLTQQDRRHLERLLEQGDGDKR
jgi:hypothetical protein